MRASLLLLLLTLSAAAQDTKAVEKALHYMKGKHLVLKTGYRESGLTFDPSGSLVSKGTPAPISLNGMFEVVKVKVSARALEITGERTALFIDARSQKVQGLKTGERLRVRLQSAADIASVTDAELLLSRVFRENTFLEELRRSYWLRLVDGKDADAAADRGDPVGILLGERPVYRVKPGVVEPPQPTYTPDPQYAENARRQKVTGRSIWEMYVNERGEPELIELKGHLDKDLDLSTVYALRNWRFKPARKAGQPVAVRIGVEVNFQLY